MLLMIRFRRPPQVGHNNSNKKASNQQRQKEHRALHAEDSHKPKGSV